MKHTLKFNINLRFCQSKYLTVRIFYGILINEFILNVLTMTHENRLERFLFLLVVVASVLFGALFLTSLARAEEPTTEEVAVGAVVTEEVASEEVLLDETVAPAELGEEAPRILPDSPWYAFKSLGRAIRSAVTRDPAKKAELKLHYANQRLLEAGKFAEQGKSEDAQAALGKFQEELKKVANLKDRLKTKSEEAGPRVDAFLEKAADYTLKHQRLLDKLEGQLPEGAFEKVKAAREKSIEHMGEVMERVAGSTEKIRERFERAFENQKGSEFKDLKNLEVLKRLEEELPEEARAGVRQAMERARERFKESVETLPDGERAEKLKKYLEHKGGEAVRELEVLEDIEAVADSALRRDLKGAKDAAFLRFRVRLEEMPEEAAGDLEHLREATDPEKLRFIERLRTRLPKNEQEAVLEVQAEALEGVQEVVGDDAAALEEFRAQVKDLPELRKKFEEKRKEFEAQLPPPGEERSAEMRERNEARREEKREAQAERKEERQEAREERREERQERREVQGTPEERPAPTPKPEREPSEPRRAVERVREFFPRRNEGARRDAPRVDESTSTEQPTTVE